MLTSVLTSCRLRSLWLRLFRFFSTTALVASVSLVAACGGGGGSSNNSSSSGGSSGSGSSAVPSPTQQPTAATAANTVGVVVNRGLTGTLPNIPTVTVTICVAGTNTCQPISNVQVDTASFGLRLLASAIPSPLLNALPVASANGGTLAECTAFADGYTWGTVRPADVKIGGETASNIPIQVIGDLGSNTVPSACAGIGNAQNTVQDLGANGILGIGVAPYDTFGTYYSCPGNTNCIAATVTQTQLVANPVPRFGTDGNGVILEMAPVSDSGAPSATGTLVFGIGTQPNNAMTASQSFNTDSWGRLNSTFNGRTLQTFLDSGSNAIFFADSALPQCGGNLGTFYCPSSTQSFSAALVSNNGATTGTATFNVANGNALLGSGANYAANNLAGQFGSSAALDLGLSFFYGRYVYYGMDMTASGGKAPYVAF
ncbi:hypothetical protein FHX59_006375 [Paraburkholderia silvatlantica]|uniref:DUF3443 domain-containing protein n=1 Tax=Paraburkholderia silvatlantica TaxID=321895 RepID=A0ABR6FWT4_9BURK|nr:DUF3443 domain-containing protein [Paraburkholderia silvatlantica]MBB2931902.1 hypothetical protein [Paraburkholderia silvatlantica]PVY24831.1 uncharacterized protein DUF3443 [Paraburkholderia silvatlantica]PXW31943.1 uncharacterized protein DUF3443 [Paraburkholderia silvatlantica]